MEECGFRRTKAVISVIRGKVGPELPSLPLRTNTKSYTRFRLCQHQRPWMTWKGYYAPRLHIVAAVYVYLFIVIGYYTLTSCFEEFGKIIVYFMAV